MPEKRRQLAKEKAVLLALRNGTALIRRGLEIYCMKADGSTLLISKSKKYESLWQDALNVLKEKVKENLEKKKR